MAVCQVSGTDHPALYSRHITTGRPHWINKCPAGLRPLSPFDCWFRFQHNHPLIKCCLRLTSDDGLEVELETPQRAIAVGQYAVFYVGDVCLGSASIVHVGPTEYQLQRAETTQHAATV